jgi:TatD DNase family protein
MSDQQISLFDTHAHLNDEQFSSHLDQVVARARAAGVVGINCIGIDVDSSQKAVEIAEQFAEVYAVVGIQPNYCSQMADGDFQRIVDMAANAKVVAIGETGLDRYWDYAPFDLQQKFFRRHIDLSLEMELPFVVHMRDCGSDIADLLEEYANRFPLRGVMHSYTGDLAVADRCLAAGLHISFAGMVTYKKSNELREIAATIPLERLLIETDAPYLSPHPKRGQRPNEPALIWHTAECLAGLHGIPVAELGRITTENARVLFGIA